MVLCIRVLWFWQYLNCVIYIHIHTYIYIPIYIYIFTHKSKFKWFWNQQIHLFTYLGGLIYYWGPASKSNFWQFLFAIIEVNQIDLKSKTYVFLYSGFWFIYHQGSPNNQYPLLTNTTPSVYYLGVVLVLGGKWQDNAVGNWLKNHSTKQPPSKQWSGGFVPP